MSAHNFWNNFSHGFMHGMFNSNPFLGCFGGWGMPFGGFNASFGGGFGSSFFGFSWSFGFNSCFAPPPIMPMTPMMPDMSAGGFTQLMPDYSPPMCNMSIMNSGSVFSDTKWSPPPSPTYMIGDTFSITTKKETKNETKKETDKKIIETETKTKATSKPDNVEVEVKKKTKSKNLSYSSLVSKTAVNDKYFDKMYQHIREREAGYANSKHDRGGETNFGVTHTTYDEYRKKKKLTKRSVKLITQEEVREIYYNIYKSSGADKIKDPQIAFVIFDFAINSGPGRAKKLLKKCGGDLDKLERLRREYYANIVKKDEKQRVHLKGWNNRLDSVIAFAKKELPSSVA